MPEVGNWRMKRKLEDGADIPSLENRFREIKEKREELKGLFHHIIHEYEQFLLQQVKATIDTLNEYANNFESYDNEIYTETKLEIEKVKLLELQTQQISQMIEEFTNLSKKLFLKEISTSCNSKDLFDEKVGEHRMNHEEFHCV